MTAELLELRAFLERPRPWGIDRQWLASLHQSVLAASNVNGVLAAMPGNGSRRPAAQTRRGVAVVPIFGPLTGRPGILSMLLGTPSVTDLQAQLVELEDDPTVSSIVFCFDSPGGEVDLIPELAAQIRTMSKPTIASVSTLAASAAYWLAAQCDRIVLSPSGQAGSIGVYCMHLDYSRQLDQAGVTPTFISAGTGKTDGNPYEPLSESARAELQDRVDALYGMFVRDVAQGRQLGSAKIRTEIGAAMYSASDAVRLGLADAVGTVEAVIAGAVVGRPRFTAAQAPSADEEVRLIAALLSDL